MHVPDKRLRARSGLKPANAAASRQQQALALARVHALPHALAAGRVDAKGKPRSPGAFLL
jgi:hypothetical protein